MDKDLIKGRILLNSEGEEDTSEFEAYVQELLHLGRLSDSTAIEGIGKLVVNRGVNNLSDKQFTYFINKGLLENNYVSGCSRCGTEIPWSEMLDAVWEEDGFCGYCRHVFEKDD